MLYDLPVLVEEQVAIASVLEHLSCTIPSTSEVTICQDK